MADGSEELLQGVKNVSSGGWCVRYRCIFTTGM
jgi:hypothetical protein